MTRATLVAMGFLASLLFTITADASEDVLIEAQLELQSGNYEHAEKWFRKLLDAEEQKEEYLVPAYLGLSRVLEEQGKISEAVAALDSGLKQQRDSSPLWARQAELHFKYGEWARARREVRKAIDLDSQNLLAKLVNASLLAEKGEIDEATTEFRSFVRIYNRTQPTDWETLLTIGEGAAIYARWESVSQIFRFVVNTLCPDALKDNPECWQAYILSGNLLLEKYNAGQALPEFHSALKINPHCSAALVALANASIQDRKYDLAMNFIDQALTANPAQLDAWLSRAVVQLVVADDEAASTSIDKLLSLHPVHQDGLACGAALLLLQQSHVDAEELQKILDGASSEEASPELQGFLEIWEPLALRNVKPGAFLERVGSILDARRKYDLAEVFYHKAVTTMPQLSGPQTSLGMLYMRTGRIDQAEEILAAAFKADPFHVRVSNMRKVIGVLKEYDTLASDHFVIRAAAADQVLAQLVSGYLEEIYHELIERYGFEPPVRPQFEIYSSARDQSGHAWFSTRMIGLPWIQTVGASTGKIVAMASPTETEKKFNWKRVIRHEFVHVLTLQKTNFNIPHWFTEAISVTEENIEMPEDWKQLLLKRHQQDKLFDLSTVNDGFQKPKTPDDWTLAYCQSYLYAQYMQQRFGESSLRTLLDAFIQTGDVATAIQNAFSVPLNDFESGYREYLEAEIQTFAGSFPPEKMSVREAASLLESPPEDATQLAEMALALWRDEEDNAAALKLVALSLEQNPGNPIATALSALDRLHAGEHEKALGILNAGAISSTQEPVFLLVQSRTFEAAGRLDEAESVLQLLIRRYPGPTSYVSRLLEFYERTAAEPAKMKQVLQKLADRDFDDIPSRKQLARLEFADDQFEEAIRWSQTGIAVDPLDPEMHRILAESSAQLRRNSQAVQAYHHLDLLGELQEPDMLQYAQLLRKTQQPDRAKEILSRLLKTNPNHKEARTLLKLLDRGT